MSARSVHLRQASSPLRVCRDCLVAAIEKIPMSQTGVIWKETHCGVLPVTEAVRDRCGVCIPLRVVSQNATEINGHIQGNFFVATAGSLLSPFPQLFPHLYQRLDLARAGKSVVDQAAIFEGTLIEISYAARTQMCQVVTKLLEFFFAQDIRFLGIGLPGHSKRCYHIRFMFAS